MAINYCCIGYCFILHQCFKTWLGNKLPFHGKYWGNIALKHRMTVLPRKATNHGKMFYNISPSLLAWCDVEVCLPSVDKNLKNLSLEIGHTIYSFKLRKAVWIKWKTLFGHCTICGLRVGTYLIFCILSLSYIWKKLIVFQYKNVSFNCTRIRW